MTFKGKNGREETAQSRLKKNEFTIQFKDLNGRARFVKRLPPPNAKGKVESGILMGKKFFVKTEE
ncbi:hypothetical protein D3C83_155680 [compost metagenome]